MFDDTISWFSSKYDSLIAWLDQSQSAIVDGITGAFELPDFYAWLKDFGKAVFDSSIDLIKDMGVSVVELFLLGVGGLLNALPAPKFLVDYSPGQMIQILTPEVVYVLHKIGFVEQVTIIGSAVSFYLARKLITLGRW